ncbi:MAG: hypothetical protein FWG02_09685 [Holophagaceae bacterium]|nr:hypothetical protein [Holophagaceae bacterium]
MRAVLATIFFLLPSMVLIAWTPENWFDAPLSDRVVHYDIKGVLDWPKNIFEGQLTLTWKNNGTAPTHELPFHLYLNAFRHPDTAYMKSTGQGNKKNSASFGFIDVTSASCNGVELTGSMGSDETLYYYQLPEAINPGQRVVITMSWVAKFPSFQAGVGRTGNYLVASMWYPKLGSYNDKHWICEPFNNNAFWGNFGCFDVELSLPNGLQLANTGVVSIPLDESGEPLTDKRGRVVEAAYDPDRKLNFIYKIHAEDVQDFSWIAAPNGSWKLSRLKLDDVDVFFYCIPKNATQLNEIKNAVRMSLDRPYGKKAIYPYPILSIVDLPPEARSAIASPTLAVLSSIAFNPISQHLVPQRMVIQQIGDQIFKGILATNEIEKKLLSDILSGWFTRKTMERNYPALINGRRFQMNHDFPDRYSAWINSFPLIKKSYPNVLNKLAFSNTNSSQTVALELFANSLGIDPVTELPLFDEVIYAFVEEKSFRHPSQGDFIKIAERISGRELWILWKNTIDSLGRLDYRIQKVTKDGAITLERRGDIISGIVLQVCLENGQESSHIWNGKDSQITFRFPAPISKAIMFPIGGETSSLANSMEATYSAKPKRRGLQYWAQHLFGAIGGILQGIGLG